MISWQAGPITVLGYGKDRYHFHPRTVAGLYVSLRIWRWILEVEA